MNVFLFLLFLANASAYVVHHNINPLFNNWNCLGMVENIDFNKPYISKIGELPLVTWKDKQDKLHTSLNICKHMGSTFDEGSVKDGCLVCPYHGLNYEDKDSVGITIEHQGKIFWSYLPNTYRPSSIPFFENKNYRKSFIEIDMDCSLKDSAYNTMDILHPTFVHSGMFGFGNNKKPENVMNYEFVDKNKIGLSFDYHSNGVLQRINKNSKSTNNYHMFEFPAFTWSRVSFKKTNHLVIGVHFRPISEKKTKWYVTIVQNYMKNNFVEELCMKYMAYLILKQDQKQMKNQYDENNLKESVMFSHTFENEEPIHKLNKLYKNITYPDLYQCINLHNDYKMRF